MHVAAQRDLLLAVSVSLAGAALILYSRLRRRELLQLRCLPCADHAPSSPKASAASYSYSDRDDAMVRSNRARLCKQTRAPRTHAGQHAQRPQHSHEPRPCAPHAQAQRTPVGHSRDPGATTKRSDYISWDDYFMAIAVLSSYRSKDPNRQARAAPSPNLAPALPTLLPALQCTTGIAVPVGVPIQEVSRIPTDSWRLLFYRATAQKTRPDRPAPHPSPTVYVQFCLLPYTRRPRPLMRDFPGIPVWDPSVGRPEPDHRKLFITTAPGNSVASHTPGGPGLAGGSVHRRTVDEENRRHRVRDLGTGWGGRTVDEENRRHVWP